MKKTLLYLLLCIGFLGYGQGSESFTNSNASSSYANNSFVGDGGITWTYVESRDHDNDSNSSGIDGKALMLRRLSKGYFKLYHWWYR